MKNTFSLKATMYGILSILFLGLAIYGMVGDTKRTALILAAIALFSITSSKARMFSSIASALRVNDAMLKGVEDHEKSKGKP